jgi:hypothetical protein
MKYFTLFFVQTILPSDAPGLCEALAKNKMSIVTAAPSVFKKLPCATGDVPGLGNGTFPICDIFINPDDSYKCLSGNYTYPQEFRLGYGGVDGFGQFCISDVMFDRTWRLVTAPEVDAGIKNPYPSITQFAGHQSQYTTDVQLYIVCGNERSITSISFYGEIVQMVILPADAKELCAALSTVGKKVSSFRA